MNTGAGSKPAPVSFVLALFVMAKRGLAIHEFRWAGIPIAEANSWMPRPSLGMTGWMAKLSAP
jgi:hypothetical protein